MSFKTTFFAILLAISTTMVGLAVSVEVMTRPPLLSLAHTTANTPISGDSEMIVGWLTGSASALEVDMTSGEIIHLEDVKLLLKLIDWVFVIGILVASLVVFDGIKEGSLYRIVRVTFALHLVFIASLVSIAVIASFYWDTMFVLFHQLLFPPGTWQFPIESTLISLYPERFWQTAAFLFLFSMVVSTSLIHLTLAVFRERIK